MSLARTGLAEAEYGACKIVTECLLNKLLHSLEVVVVACCFRQDMCKLVGLLRVVEAMLRCVGLLQLNDSCCKFGKIIIVASVLPQGLNQLGSVHRADLALDLNGFLL